MNRRDNMDAVKPDSCAVVGSGPGGLCGREVNGPRVRRGGRRLFVAGIALLVLTIPVVAQQLISVPNGSFESPEAGPPFFADLRIDSWEKTPEPPGYDTNVFGPWAEKTGVFFNTNTPPTPVIDNMDGLQGAFLFSYPGVGFFQDYHSIGGTNAVPSHEFDATFNVGRGYLLSAGFTVSSSFPVVEGATADMVLYYRGASSNRVPVAGTTVTFSTNVFTNIFHLLDFHLVVPTVDEADAWAGERMGIEIVSSVDPGLIGGVWDVDHVRLSEFISPALVAPGLTGSDFTFTLLSDPGARVEILTSTNAAAAVSSWSTWLTVTNATGMLQVSDASAGAAATFYAARQLE